MSNTEALRAAAQQALETLEQLQGGCTDSGDGTVEAITVWCPEIIDALRAALAQPAETDAELERRTGEPHIDGYPLFSGLPPPAQPAASGELAELWALWACDQETGREHLARQGGEAEIRAELQRASNAGRDVWALDPQGRKHLPAAPQPAPALVPQWIPAHERVPAPGTECVVLLRYTLDRPPFVGVDKWDIQREDPIGMGGPTIETGEGWNDNYEGDVIAWFPVPPHPPVEWRCCW